MSFVWRETADISNAIGIFDLKLERPSAVLLGRIFLSSVGNSGLYCPGPGVLSLEKTYDVIQDIQDLDLIAMKHLSLRV